MQSLQPGIGNNELFLREMASRTVSKTTITSSPPGVATARVPFWTSASLHSTRLGILSISSVLIVADSLVMKVFMRKMMQLSAKIATLSSLHPNVEGAIHPSLKITFHL